MCLCVFLSGGCLTWAGRHFRSDRGWHETPHPGGLGFSLPVPLVPDYATLRERGEALFVEVSYWGGSGRQYDDLETVEVRDYSVGIGKLWWRDPAVGGNWGERSSKQYGWGGSVGLSYLDVSLDDSVATFSDRTLGFYAGVGCYNPCFGGLLLRWTFAPDVELRMIDRSTSSFTMSYCFGWGLPYATVVSMLYAPLAMCQAHELLNMDPVVRTTAEELLLMMGEREFPYMEWAAREAEPALAARIREVMDAIRRGATPDPSRWPSAPECIERLSHPDPVVSMMAAQMLRAMAVGTGVDLSGDVRDRVEKLLARARARSLAGPWRKAARRAHDGEADEDEKVGKKMDERAGGDVLQEGGE